MKHYTYQYSDDPQAEAASARECHCGDPSSHVTTGDAATHLDHSVHGPA